MPAFFRHTVLALLIFNLALPAESQAVSLWGMLSEAFKQCRVRFKKKSLQDRDVNEAYRLVMLDHARSQEMLMVLRTQKPEVLRVARQICSGSGGNLCSVDEAYRVFISLANKTQAEMTGLSEPALTSVQKEKEFLANFGEDLVASSLLAGYGFFDAPVEMLAPIAATAILTYSVSRIVRFRNALKSREAFRHFVDQLPRDSDFWQLPYGLRNRGTYQQPRPGNRAEETRSANRLRIDLFLQLFDRPASTVTTEYFIRQLNADPSLFLNRIGAGQDAFSNDYIATWLSELVEYSNAVGSDSLVIRADLVGDLKARLMRMRPEDRDYIVRRYQEIHAERYPGSGAVKRYQTIIRYQFF